MARIDAVPAAIVLELPDKALGPRLIGPSDDVKIIVRPRGLGRHDIGLGAAAIAVAGPERIARQVVVAIIVAFAGFTTIEDPCGAMVGLAFKIMVDLLGRAVAEAVAIIDGDDDVDLGG